jgi:hypothetical protein
MGWFIPGAVAAVVGFIGGLILQQAPEVGMASVMPALFAGLGGCGAMLFGWRTWTKPAAGIFTRLFALVLMGIGIGILGMGIADLYFLGEYPLYRIGGALVLAGLATMAAMIHLLGAPTFEGAKVLSRIEGFKLYLTTAETNRMNMREAPQMSEELFERFLPYAAGLGVEEPWSKAFAEHLSRVDPGRHEGGDRFGGGGVGGDGLVHACAEVELRLIRRRLFGRRWRRRRRGWLVNASTLFTKARLRKGIPPA